MVIHRGTPPPIDLEAYRRNLAAAKVKVEGKYSDLNKEVEELAETSDWVSMNKYREPGKWPTNRQFIEDSKAATPRLVGRGTLFGPPPPNPTDAERIARYKGCHPVKTAADAEWNEAMYGFNVVCEMEKNRSKAPPSKPGFWPTFKKIAGHTFRRVSVMAMFIAVAVALYALFEWALVSLGVLI